MNAAAILAALSAAICVCTLVLITGVITRLREHEQALARLSGTAGPPAVPLTAVGERIGDFYAETVDGERLARDELHDGTLVGFFSPDCDTCHEQLPGFVASAAAQPGGRNTTLAVVSEGPGAKDLVQRLRQASRVAVEPMHGPLQRAFAVRMYPAFCRLGRAQVVLTHGHEPGHAVAARQ